MGPTAISPYYTQGPARGNQGQRTGTALSLGERDDARGGELRTPANLIPRGDLGAWPIEA